MTTPFQFPNIQQGQTIMDPGTGGAIASSLAQVLAAQQQQRENQFRQQQLAQAQQQQQALAAYYQGTLGVQNRQENRLDAQAQSERQGRAQVGGAMRGALGSTPPQQGEPGLFQQVLGGGAQAIAPGMSSIFGGVSDENLPAAVQGVQEVQALAPKEPELPTSGKEFEYLKRLAQRNPEQAALYKTLFLDPKPTTVINNIGPAGETEFSKKWAEAQVGFLQEGRKAAEGAINGFAALNEAYGLADKAFTGIGAGAQLNAARVLGALGVKPAKDATENTQTLIKLTGEGALMYLRSRDLGSGTAVSDADREFVIRLAGGDISLDRGSIKKILRVNAGAGIMKTQDAVADLRDQAVAYPQNAPELLRQAKKLDAQLKPIWTRYAEMLVREGVSVDDIRERMIRGGVEDPEAIIRTLPRGSQVIVPLGDQIFPRRR